MRRVAARKEKRRGRIAYGRVELHDVDDDIMRVFLANVSFYPAKSLVGIERTEDRGSRRFDTTSRLASPWLETPPLHATPAGIGKIPVGLRALFFSALAYPLARINLFGLRFNVRRYPPQHQAPARGMPLSYVRTTTFYGGTPITSD